MKEDISEKEKTAALLAENRGEAALFQRRENLQKHTSYASERMQYEAIKNGQVERIRSVMQFRKKLHILSVTGIFRQSRNV